MGGNIGDRRSFKGCCSVQERNDGVPDQVITDTERCGCTWHPKGLLCYTSGESTHPHCNVCNDTSKNLTSLCMRRHIPFRVKQ